MYLSFLQSPPPPVAFSRPTPFPELFPRFCPSPLFFPTSSSRSRHLQGEIRRSKGAQLCISRAQAPRTSMQGSDVTFCYCAPFSRQMLVPSHPSTLPPPSPPPRFLPGMSEVRTRARAMCGEKATISVPASIGRPLQAAEVTGAPGFQVSLLIAVVPSRTARCLQHLLPRFALPLSLFLFPLS